MAELSFGWPSNGTGDGAAISVVDSADFFLAVNRGPGVVRGVLNDLIPTVSGTSILLNTGWAIGKTGHPYRNNTSLATVITTPTTGTTGHRIVLREDLTAQTVRVFDIASADGTAGIPAAASTDVTICTLTITTGGAITMTDAREYCRPASGWQLVGANTTPASTTSTSAVDSACTVTGLNIPVTSWVMVRITYRKQALAAQAIGVGLKINTTTVLEAANTAGRPRSSATNGAESGFCEFLIPPRQSANYGFGMTIDYACFIASGGFAKSFADDLGSAATGLPAMAAALPQAVITSITPRIINVTSNNAAEIGSVAVYEMPATLG